MSVDTNNTELKKGADLATIADQRDDQRQQAEAEAALEEQNEVVIDAEPEDSDDE